MSIERVDHLMALSREVYPAIEQSTGGEIRARQIVRLGIGAAARALCIGNDIPVAGAAYHRLLVDQLGRGGLSTESPAYGPFPHYTRRVTQLPKSGPFHYAALDTFANKYSDVKRRTITGRGEWESDAEHATHLSALALPYAAEHYPALDQGKVAMYCLIHDILEAYTGDVPTLGISAEAHSQKQAAEAQALEALKKDYGRTHPTLVAVIESYEQLEDTEARYVKTFDKLDPSFTTFENSGASLLRFHRYRSADEYLSACDQTTQRMAGYAHDFPELMQDRLELLERVAAHTPWRDAAVSDV